MFELFKVESLPDDYQRLWYKEEEQPLFDLIRSGESVADRWKPLLLKIWKKGKTLPSADFPSFELYTLIANERGWQALRPLIEKAVEALPILHPSGKPYYVLNVTRIIDCLFLDKCETNRLPNDPDAYFSSIYTYAFDENTVRDEHLFRCPQMKELEIYASSELKNSVERNGLTGLRFTKIFPNSE